MHCLQSIPRAAALPLQIPHGPANATKPSASSYTLASKKIADSYRGVRMKAISVSTSSAEMGNPEAEEEKSDTYSRSMTEAMGAILTYRHELGMNYDFIRPDLIVGSCLQSRADLDKLLHIGVKTIFCLQQDADLEYFGVDISDIQEYAKSCNHIQHLRAEIRDFDAYDLRMRLPAVVSKLYKAININGGVTYVHCTAGLGRAPAVALAYMFWVHGYKLGEAHSLLLSKRPCFPKLDAIKCATLDILTGFRKKLVTLTWEGDNNSTVEISGLHIGWGQRIPLQFDEERGLWVLQQELPEGCYEYKYFVNGEWTCNKHERVTIRDKDGHVNNYVQVSDDDPDDKHAALRQRAAGDDPYLTSDERLKIRRVLEAYPEEKE